MKEEPHPDSAGDVGVGGGRAGPLPWVDGTRTPLLGGAGPRAGASRQKVEALRWEEGNNAECPGGGGGGGGGPLDWWFPAPRLQPCSTIFSS